MPVRYRRTALAALAALAAGTALALAGPSVTTGSMWVQGSGYGTVSVHGDVVVLGATTGPGQLEVRTGRSGASIGMNGHQRRIAPNRDVVVNVPAGAQFGVTTNWAPFKVTIRGRRIAATIAGTGVVTFTGHGIYTGYGTSISRAWTRVPVQLRQPSDAALVRGRA